MSTLGWRDRFAGRPRRRGMGLVEMAVAGALLATMVLITLQIVDWAARDRQASARREAATRLVADVLERVLAHPWAEISAEQLAPLVAATNARRSPSGGTLKVEVTPAAPVDGLGRKKVVVEVAWTRRPGSPGSPVRLVAWATERGGDRP